MTDIDDEGTLTAPDGSPALFDGDTGRLSLEQREVVNALLKQPYIWADNDPKRWRVIIQDERAIRSFLNDVFLDLHVDYQHGVAFKRQVVSETGGRFPTLLHDTAHGREETLLLIYLRTQSRAQRAAGVDAVMVERQDMHDFVVSLRPAHATDVSGDKARADRAIDNLITDRLLLKPKGADGSRLRVTPVIDVIMPLPRLQELLEWLKTQNRSDDNATSQEVLGA